ncbi:MAG: NAD-dependent protein deacylase [Verrucomicrobiales bacterium]|nr:NAD-dependent protein deacylase [Verrucomicrobiales bacterium]
MTQNKSGKTVILTGAGISAESGLQTFRDANGLWEGHRPEEVATPEAFASNPDMVHRFYNARRQKLAEVKPNAAHQALVDLENYLGDDFLLITQNVDDLHERAGIQRVMHLHGELLKKRCSWCNQVDRCDSDLSVSDVCPVCDRPEGMRPHIVWFGEMPFRMEEIINAIKEADQFWAIGTSGQVYPAAGFVEIAKSAGASTVEMNLEAASNSSLFDESIIGPATETLPPFVGALIAS